MGLQNEINVRAYRIKSKLLNANIDHVKELGDDIKIIHREYLLRKKYYPEWRVPECIRDLKIIIDQLKKLGVIKEMMLPVKYKVKLTEAKLDKYADKLIANQEFGEKSPKKPSDGKSNDIWVRRKRIGGYFQPGKKNG